MALPPKPYPSWVVHPDTGQYVAPIDLPDTQYLYTWDETNIRWVSTGRSLDNPLD